MLKVREQELKTALIQKLPQSSSADELFEYLAVRLDNEKTKLSKELNEQSLGRIKELSELLNLFSPVKSSSE